MHKVVSQSQCPAGVSLPHQTSGLRARPGPCGAEEAGARTAPLWAGSAGVGARSLLLLTPGGWAQRLDGTVGCAEREGAEAELEERRPGPRCTLTAGAAPRALSAAGRGTAGGGLGAGTCAGRAAGSGGPGARSPRRECRLHLAPCTHVCACSGREGSRAAGTGPSLWIPQARALPRSPPGEGAAGPGGAVGGGARRGGPRAPYKSAMGTWRGPRGGGRWPCDVAGVAEFGCAVPGCPVPGAGKLPFPHFHPSFNRISIPKGQLEP